MATTQKPEERTRVVVECDYYGNFVRFHRPAYKPDQYPEGQKGLTSYRIPGMVFHPDGSYYEIYDSGT